MTEKHKKTVKERRQAINRARAELVEFPKAPVRDVHLPIVLQFRFSLLVSLVFPLLAGIFYLLEEFGTNTDIWFHAMCVTLVISGILSLILIMFSIWILVLALRLRQLASGNYYVHWSLPTTEWETERDNSPPTLLKLVSLASLITTGVGLSAAMQAYADENLFFDTTSAHFGFTALISTSIGLVIGCYLWQLFRLKSEFIYSSHGCVLIGPYGIYRTGNFWSFDGTFQQLYDAAVTDNLVTDNFSGKLTLKIGTSGEHRVNYEIVSIPIPKGERLKAKLLCRMLEEKCSLALK